MLSLCGAADIHPHINLPRTNLPRFADVTAGRFTVKQEYPQC